MTEAASECQSEGGLQNAQSSREVFRKKDRVSIS